MALSKNGGGANGHRRRTVTKLGVHFTEFVRQWRKERRESAEEFQKFRDAMRSKFHEIETRMQ